jgi:hypothetical protein
MTKPLQDQIAELIYDRAEGLLGPEEGNNEAECNQLAIDILDLFSFSSTYPQEPGWYRRLRNSHIVPILIPTMEFDYWNGSDMAFMPYTDLWAKALVPSIPITGE